MKFLRITIWFGVVALGLNAFSAQAGWFDQAWGFRKLLSINYTNVAGPLTNFPVLVSRTDTELQNYAKSNAYDLVFTTADGTTRLAHEIESFSNGTLVAWVKLPLLSSTSNTLFYLYYGNASSTNQQNPTMVWDGNYSAVWHLDETANGSSREYKDATSNARDARGRGGIPNLTAGKLGSGQAFDGASDYIESESNIAITGNNVRTLSFWTKLNSASAAAIAGWGNANNNENFVAGAYGNYWTLAGYGTGNDWTSIAAATTGNWQFNTIVHNGSTVRWYVNGAEIGSGFAHTYATTDSKVILGYSIYAGTSYYLNGILDEVRISNLARSLNWIRTEYTNQNSPTTFLTTGTPESGPGRPVITAINSGVTPKYGTTFSVTVSIQNATGVAQTATNNTIVNLSLASGAGTLGGILTGTITNGSSSVTINGATYNRVESSVSIIASRSSGDVLAAGTSSTFNVTQAPLTITANSASRVYGSTNPSFTASYNGWVNGDTSNVLSGTPSFSTSATTNSAPGTYAIVPALGSLSTSNYTFTTFSNGTLTITKASSALTVGVSANPVATGSNVVLTATISAIAPATGTATGVVQFRSDGQVVGSAATLVGGIARLTNSALAHGAHTITAEYAGDTNFSGSSNNLGTSLVINTAPRTGTDSLERYALGGVKIRIANLLTNDSDLDGDGISFLSFDAATMNGGTVSSNSGWLIYTPATGFTNADSFNYTILDTSSLQSTGLVTISLRTSTNSAENVVSTQILTNGQRSVRLSGIPGRSYTIQFATNSINPTWSSLTNLAANSRGEITFTDTTSTNSTARYYRSIQP